MEPEKTKQLEAQLKSLFKKSMKSTDEIEYSRSHTIAGKVIIRRRNTVSRKAVS